MAKSDFINQNDKQAARTRTGFADCIHQLKISIWNFRNWKFSLQRTCITRVGIWNLDYAIGWKGKIENLFLRRYINYQEAKNMFVHFEFCMVGDLLMKDTLRSKLMAKKSCNHCSSLITKDSLAFTLTTWIYLSIFWSKNEFFDLPVIANWIWSNGANLVALIYTL